MTIEGVRREVDDALGARIRHLRQEQGLSLRALAQRSDLSVGFLSQVERGISSIALSSLRALAAALDRPIADFFAEPVDASAAETEPPVGPGSFRPVPHTPVPGADAVVFTLTRAAERTGRVVSVGRHYELLSARVPGLVLEPMLVHIEPGGVMEPSSSHEGEEFAYVLRGELLYEVAGVEHRLGPGDSLYLRSNTPHRMHNDGTETTVVVSVVTPRHY